MKTGKDNIGYRSLNNVYKPEKYQPVDFDDQRDITKANLKYGPDIIY